MAHPLLNELGVDIRTVPVDFTTCDLEVREIPGHTNGCVADVAGDRVLIDGCDRTDFRQGDTDRHYDSVHTQLFGQIAGAELVPLSTVPIAATDWNPDDSMLLIGRGGNRLVRAATARARMGFRELFNLTGGMLAWKANGLPALCCDDTPMARRAAHERACFVAAAGGDVAYGTRAFLMAKGTPADTPESLCRALRALATSEDADADDRAEWVVRFERRLAGMS